MDKLELILNQIKKERVVELLLNAVNHYSPSYAEEPAMKVFAYALNHAGIPFYRQPLPGSTNVAAENERANLIIEMGPKPIELLWVGHVDTIALHDDDIGAKQVGDQLFGLGAADMKSGCAAIIEALSAIRSAEVPLQRGLAVALVVGEEESGDGAAALDDVLLAPVTVIGEPTNLVPCTHHYGYLECRLITKGVRAHAALPEMGANAIHAMLSWILQILNQAHKLPFGHAITINPRQIQGGASSFVIAETCEALLDVHLLPEAQRQPVMDLVHQTIELVEKSHEKCRFEFEEVFWEPGYRANSDDRRLHPLRKAFERLELEWSPGVFRSHSDGNQLYERGTVPVICGPGSLQLAHTRGEKVSLEEVKLAARLYAAMIYETCVKE